MQVEETIHAMEKYRALSSLHEACAHEPCAYTPFTVVACLSLSTFTFGVAADDTQDIPTNAAGTGVHDSLVSALDHVNLTATLAGDGPFTVFAPTDQAFADAGIDLSTFDTDEENQTLANILLYHVLDGAVDSANVSDGLVAATLNGNNILTYLRR